MMHRMKLNKEPFSTIKSGLKTIEMRLNDEKRQLIKVGDTIEFSLRGGNELLLCRVVSLAHFKDFYQLYAHFDKSVLGYLSHESAHAEDMSQYYPAEEIEKYGTLAIEIQLI